MLKAALLERCDHLVVGSGVMAMIRALSLPVGETVLLIGEDTCLYGDIDRTGDLRVPRGLSQAWETLLFPPQTRDCDGLLHPDRLKRYGEELFARRGIRLLYACQVLGLWEGMALVAHKSGLYAVGCGAAYDCRDGLTPQDPCYCLHLMRDGEHQVLALPTAFAGATPEDRYRRYAQALTCLPKGCTLARGGTEASELDGLDLSAAMQGACLRAGEWLYPTGAFVPQSQNPLFEAQKSIEFPALAPQEEACDILVVGGGTAGAAAALYSARMGYKTTLLEMNRQLGGSATVGGVSTYWFGLRTGATRDIDRAVDEAYRRLGLARRKCLWSEDDVFLPDLKAHVLLGLCLEAGVQVRMGCVACGVQKRGDRVTGVLYAMEGRARLARAQMILDCTGDGDLGMFAGAAHTYGSEIDGMTYWASLAQYTTPDNYRNNFSTMVHVGDPLDYTRFILAGRLRGDHTYDHGRYVAVRESRHIRGMAVVTLEQLVAMRAVEQPLYTCFSNYDPKGRLTADMAYFGMLPPNQLLVVPRGAVIPVDEREVPIRGLLIGGKAISCTHDAFPGLRMQPDLQRQGLALAALAACAIAQKTDPWLAENVVPTIRALGGDWRLPELPAQAGLKETIDALGENEPWEWLDAPPDNYHTSPAPVIRVMTAPRGEAVPLLRQALQRAQEPGLRLTLSRLLLWHGDEDGAAEVMAAAYALLAKEPGLPRRVASINYGQLLPDHGLMPELVYLLNSLGNAPRTDVSELFGQVLKRLEAGPRDWRDLRCGVYCYGECFAYAAIHRRDKALEPMLLRVLALPELNREADDELMRERFHMLRITLLHALKVLGNPAGDEGLRAYQNDPRRILRQAAEKLRSEA